jgi:hypothetical protein
VRASLATGEVSVSETAAGGSGSSSPSSNQERGSAERAFTAGYFGLIGGVFILASALGLALTWDASLYLYSALDNGHAMVPYRRFIDIPLQDPVILLRGLSDNMALLSFIFNLSYFLVPLIALASSIWLVRRREPRLFVWAGLGIGLVALPGQANLVSEAIMALQLTWPILLAILSGSLAEDWDVVLVLALVIVVTHPIAVPLLLGLAVLTAIRRPTRVSRRLGTSPTDRWEVVSLAAAAAVIIYNFAFPLGTWHLALIGVAAAVAVAAVHEMARKWAVRDASWVVLFLALATLAAIRSAGGDLGANHADEMSMSYLRYTFNDSVAGSPLVALAFAYASCVMLVIGTLARRLDRTRLARATDLTAFCCVVAAGLILVPWALNTNAWWHSLDYRTWLPLLSVPVMALAFLDATLLAGLDTTKTNAGAVGRRCIALAQAGVMVVVVSSLAFSWFGLSSRLAQEMASSPNACLAVSSLPWTDTTALDHWSITSESIVQAGRTPTHIVLQSCGADFSGGIPVTPWSTRTYVQGWFNMSPLKDSLQGGR